jgi:hypothetical protein
MNIYAGRPLRVPSATSLAPGVEFEGEEDDSLGSNGQCREDASELGGRDDQDTRGLKPGQVKIPIELRHNESASGSEGICLHTPTR